MTDDRTPAGVSRRDQMILICSFIGFSWLAMQAVHELGHVVGAMLSGGKVIRVVLLPWVISRTDVDPNPHPLLVVWSGPIIGALLPLLAWLVARAMRAPGLYLFRFFAGFCLIANGVYIGAGSLSGIADAGDMLRSGAPQWSLIAFGLATAPAGLYLWNGLGQHFGFAGAQNKVDRRAALVSLALFIALAMAEAILDR